MKTWFSNDPTDFYDTDDLSEKSQKKQPWNWGYVYLLDMGDLKHIKIGRTKRLHHRLQELQETPVKMPVKTKMSYIFVAEVDTNYELAEQLLQMKFDEYHVEGEWFDFNIKNGEPIMVDVLETMAAMSAGNYYFFDTWFDRILKLKKTKEMYEYYRTNNFVVKTERITLMDKRSDEEKLRVIYENTSYAPEVYGQRSKYLKWGGAS